jgi:3'-5' exoribonuclease
MNTIDKIRAIVDGIQNSPLRNTCYTVINQPKFAQAPASIKHHHAYTGGLAEHTLEVLRYLETMIVMFPEANKDVLITAAVWHDYLKVREYVADPIWTTEPFNAEWRYTDDGFGRKIGHISAGAALFAITALDKGVVAATAEQVVHCILAHHGRREWGSPVEPQTLEALLLHQADMLSANYGQTKEVAP